MVPATVMVAIGALAVCGFAYQGAAPGMQRPLWEPVSAPTTAPLNKFAASSDQVCSLTKPKPGFNPLTATEAQDLAAGDFPPRPPGGQALVAWLGLVKMYLAGEVTTCVGPGLANAPGSMSLDGPNDKRRLVAIP